MMLSDVCLSDVCLKCLIVVDAFDGITEKYAVHDLCVSVIQLSISTL